MQDKKLEVKIEADLRKLIKFLGGFCYKFEAEKGLPDRVIGLPGGPTLFVELKQDSGRLSAIQKARIHDMRSRGALVSVLYGQDGLGAFFNDIAEYQRGRGPQDQGKFDKFSPLYVYCRRDHPHQDNRRQLWRRPIDGEGVAPHDPR